MNEPLLHKAPFLQRIFLNVISPISPCVYICLRTCTVNISVARGSSKTIKLKKLRTAKCAKTKAKVHKSHDMDVFLSSQIKIWTRFPRRNKTVKKSVNPLLFVMCADDFAMPPGMVSLQQQLEQLHALYQNDQLPVGYDFHSNKNIN